MTQDRYISATSFKRRSPLIQGVHRLTMEETLGGRPYGMEEDLFSGTYPRVFVTTPDEPEEGRIFVWSKTRYYERIEGESGAVEFTPLAETEDDLREQLTPDESDQMTEIDDEFARIVRDEFGEQTPLYPEAPELSDQET